MVMPGRQDLAVRHLQLWLSVQQRALRAAVARQAADGARLDHPDLANVCVTDLHVAHLLDDVEADLRPVQTEAPSRLIWSSEELAVQDRLRQEAAGQAVTLPLDQLAEQHSLGAAELELLVLCAAVELDRRYERIYAYITDDVKSPFPCIELACRLTATSWRERMERRIMLGRFGRLRRCRLIEVMEEGAGELRAGLKLGPGVFEFLTGAAALQADQWQDGAEFLAGATANADGPLQVVAQRLAGGEVDVVGLWGRPAGAVEDAACSIAQSAGRSLRRLTLPMGPGPADAALHEQLLAAAALEAIVVVAVAPLTEPDCQRTAAILIDMLARTRTPCILIGAEPWRPTELLARRRYVELELPTVTLARRCQEWQRWLPDADPRRLEDLAGRFHQSGSEIQAAAQLARQQAAMDCNGKLVRVEDRLDAACAAVARKHSGRLLQHIKPRRGPDDLILAPELHRQIVEIASFTRALPRVTETWGFGRRGQGLAGIKAMFTGDPGTGKTLAAEVIASLLAVPLLRVNIAQTVSKWIGETSKNLDEAFDEAEASQAVLFIDEADALCGKRGEVRHGSDRYANIEVSHLLERLENHVGIVLLASNLKDNIDAAFLRRFQVVLQFPRPAPAERRRLWQAAFPAEAPLEPGLDCDSLARFDMTGAGIVGAARTAALLAAASPRGVIGKSHVLQGIVRQYRREGRMLTRAELGPDAVLLQEA